MDIISGLLSQTQPKPQSAHETITRLCDRLQHSTLLEDRRAAILGLKGFSREYREAVAVGALRSFIQVLHRDVEDTESCRATLETLIILFIKPDDLDVLQGPKQRARHKRYMSPLLAASLTSNNSQQDEGGEMNVDYISLWLTDEFTQKEENIYALIDLLQNSDFYIKLYALQLLSAIISNRPRRAQDCIFAAPLGISAIVSVLDDHRDAIRNEAILVLLNLVSDHTEVQKLVAFEGTFEKLFSILEIEGGLSGGVVAEDCLMLMSLLLRYNVSNQNLFRESNCIVKLGQLLQLPDDGEGADQGNGQSTEAMPGVSSAPTNGSSGGPTAGPTSGTFTNGTSSNSNVPTPVSTPNLNGASVFEDDRPPFVWDDQLALNLTNVLEICRLFVLEGHWETPANQIALCKAGILINVLRLAFGGITSLPVRACALYTVADIIRSNKEIQSDFFNIDVPYIDLSVATLQTPKEPVIIPVIYALLNWSLLTTSVHAFDLRAAAHLCFNSAFQDNAEAKMQFMRDEIVHFTGKPLPSSLIDSGTDSRKVEKLNEANAEDGTNENQQNSHKQSVDQPTEEPPQGFDPLSLPSDTANLISVLAEYDPDARLNPYKLWFACVILIKLLEDAQEVRDLLRNVTIGNEDLGEDTVSFLQATSGLLVASLQLPDARISIAYIMLFSYWLYDDVNAVNDFLGESSTVQALISLVTFSGGKVGHHPLLEPMAAILLGIVYDFTPKDAPIPRVDLHKLLSSSIGRDQYATKVRRIKEISFFREFEEEMSLDSTIRDDTGLPVVFLCGLYVKLIKENFTRIQSALDRDPLSEPNSKVSLEMYDNLQSQYREVCAELAELKATFSSTSSATSEKMQTLETNLKKALTDVEEKNVTIGESSERITSLSKEVADLKSALASLTEADNKLKAEHEADLAKLSETSKNLKDLEKLEKKLSGQLQAAMKDKEKAEAGINKMNRELLALTKSKADLDSTISGSNSKIAELEKKLQKAADAEAKLQADLKAAQLESKGLQARISALEGINLQYQTLKSQHDSLVSELQQLRQDYSESENLKKAVIDKLRVAGSQIESYKASESSLEEQVKSLQVELNAIRSQNSSAEERLATATSELQAKLEDATKKVDALKKDVSEKSARIVELEKSLSEHSSDASEIKSSIEASQKEVDNLTKQNSELLKQLEDAKAATKNKSKEVDGVRKDGEEKLAALQKEKERLETALSEKEKDRNDSKQVSTDSSEEQKKEIDALQSQLEQLKKESQEEIDKLKSSYSAQIAKAVESAKKAQAAAQEIEKLEKELSEKDADIAKQVEDAKKSAVKGMVEQSQYDEMMLFLNESEEGKNKYKMRLKELGESVSSDDDDDVDDDDDDDDE